MAFHQMRESTSTLTSYSPLECQWNLFPILEQSLKTSTILKKKKKKRKFLQNRSKKRKSWKRPKCSHDNNNDNSYSIKIKKSIRIAMRNQTQFCPQTRNLSRRTATLRARSLKALLRNRVNHQKVQKKRSLKTKRRKILLMKWRTYLRTLKWRKS